MVELNLKFSECSHLTVGLANALEQYEKVILFKEEDLLPPFFQWAAAQVATPQQILILSTGIQPDYPEFPWTYVRMQKAQIEKLEKLYHIYEFSDRFSVFSRATTHSTLLNYWDSKLLGIEEVFEALMAQVIGS